MIIQKGNRYYRHLGIFMLLAFCLVTHNNCSPDIADSEAGNPVITANALINMPSSLASPLPPKTRTVDKSEDIYQFIRHQNHTVNYLINGPIFSVRWLINAYISKLPWKMIVSQGQFVSDSGFYHFEASYTASDSLPYKAKIDHTQPGAEWSVQAAFNGKPFQPQGWVYYYVKHTAEPQTDSIQILISFSKKNSVRTCDVTIDQKVLTTVGDFAQSFIYTLYENNGVVHLSAASYHPFLDSILVDTVGHCYTYTAVADTNANQAVVKLGLPPASYNDTTLIFTEYGIANLFGRYFINYELAALDDSSKMILATSYKDSLSILAILTLMATNPNFQLRPASEVNTMTVDDLIFYLAINKNILPLLKPQERIKYIALLWVLKLRQPVYFSRFGYAGNGETIPLGFEVIAATPCNRGVHIPRQVRDLVITLP